MVRRSTLFGNMLLMGGLAMGLSSSQPQMPLPVPESPEEQIVYTNYTRRLTPRSFADTVEEVEIPVEEVLPNGKMALFGAGEPLESLLSEDNNIEYESESTLAIEALKEGTAGPIRVEWIDEMGSEHWVEYPNSCGVAALYMFLTGLGIEEDFDNLVKNLRAERPGGYDPYCCLDGSRFQKYAPDPLGFCNPACVSSEALANVAREHYNLDIESGSGWTHEMVEEKLEEDIPVIILVRVNFSVDQFGHYVVVTDSEGDYAIVADSYPGEAYWSSTSEERRAAGAERWVLWSDLMVSWGSKVDPKDPLGGPHSYWAMSLASKESAAEESH